MKSNKKKEELISKLRKANYEVFMKVHNEETFEDIHGNDPQHFFSALRYVPNKVLKQWIKNCKKEVDVQSNIERKIQREEDRSKHSS